MSEGSDGSDNDDVNGKENRIDPKAQVAANVRKVAFGGSTSHGGDDHDGSDIVFEQAQDVTSRSGYGNSAFDGDILSLVACMRPPIIYHLRCASLDYGGVASRNQASQPCLFVHLHDLSLMPLCRWNRKIFRSLFLQRLSLFFLLSFPLSSLSPLSLSLSLSLSMTFFY
jgi:hypothetical protein